MNHTGLREAGYQCITCHANISHPGTQLEVARVSQNKMPICARCHDGKQLPDDCNICHVGGAPPEEINVPIEGKVTPSQMSGVPPGKRARPSAPTATTASQMPHPAGWMKSHGPIVVDRGKSICVSLPPQGRPEVLHRLPRPRDAASRRLAVRARRLHAAEPEEPAEVRQVPRQEQLHQVPRPADAAPVRLDVAALERRARARPACAPSATAARSASAATASSCRTAAPSSPTTRTTRTARAACA